MNLVQTDDKEQFEILFKSILLEKYEREDYINKVFLKENPEKTLKTVTIYDYSDPLLI